MRRREGGNNVLLVAVGTHTHPRPLARPPARSPAPTRSLPLHRVHSHEFGRGRGERVRGRGRRREAGTNGRTSEASEQVKKGEKKMASGIEQTCICTAPFARVSAIRASMSPSPFMTGVVFCCEQNPGLYCNYDVMYVDFPYQEGCQSKSPRIIPRTFKNSRQTGRRLVWEYRVRR